MNKKTIIGAMCIILVTLIFLFLSMQYKNYGVVEEVKVVDDGYLYGEANGLKGSVKVKLKVGNDGKIKDISVTEFSSDYQAVPAALQKLVKSVLDKYNGYDVDTVSGATDTSNTFKEAVNKALNYKEYNSIDVYDRVSLKDKEVLDEVTREEIETKNRYSIRTGLGAYVVNSFFDADYNKNGDLVTHEYICGVVIEQNGRISQVKFDHIGSNINFDRKGQVPTGSVRMYKFASDKSEPRFNGICTDGSLINIFNFEDAVIRNKFYSEVEKNYQNKKGYEPFLKALQLAVENAKYIGGNGEDSLGIASVKQLEKRNIINATDEENGRVVFDSFYVALTLDKEQGITSCVLDESENVVTLTSDGKVLGSRDGQIYTLNDLSNGNKYSRIERKKVEEKKNINKLSDLFTGYTVNNLVTELSNATDEKGNIKADGNLAEYEGNNMIKYIDLITNAYLNAKIIY